MKLLHYWNLFGLLVSITHLANGQVAFDFQGTSCKSQDITLGCTISSFLTDATWKRGDGSVLRVTCSFTGPCSSFNQTIDGTTYSFRGNTSGIYMWTTLPLSEHGVYWTCIYNSTDYIYQFELGCSASSNPKKSCGLHPLWCFLGSIIGSLLAILVYKICIKRHYWKKFYLIVGWIVVWAILSAIVCYFACLENGWYSFFAACSISFVMTLIWIAIVHCREKLKDDKDKRNNPPTLDDKDKLNNPPTLGDKDELNKLTTLGNTNKPNTTPTIVPSEKVMLLVKSVDKGIISAFEWISELGNLSKDRDRNSLKYSFGSSLKVSLVIHSLSKEDNGIYQCVRTLPHEEKDKINVVLCVTNACPTYLVVNPFVWEDQLFEDLSPVDLKKIVTKFDRNSLNEVTETLNSQDGRKADNVDWECSSKPIKKGESKEINGCTILSASDAGEYRCTVHLSKKTYVFIFYIHYLDEKDSRPQTNEHVFGVPSMLNSNREESKTGRNQKTRHTATSEGIHKEPIEGQVTDFHLPHTIHKKMQQHDTP